MRTGVVVRRAEELVAVAVDDEDADQHRQEHERLDPRALDRAAAQLPREADVAPGVAVRGEELPHVVSGVVVGFVIGSHAATPRRGAGFHFPV